MKEIPLSRGYVAIVDDDDYETLLGYRWRVYKSPHGELLYATRAGTEGENRRVMMHRQILGVKHSHEHVDHRDGNGLNNCKENLRECTHAQNMRNRKMHKSNKVGRKGVYLDRGMYRAQIVHNRVKIHIGCFRTAEAAGAAYDAMSKKLHGGVARANP